MFDIKFLYDTRFTFGPLTLVAGEDRNLKMLPQSQQRSASRQYMDKFHIFWPSHLQQVVPDQV
jgi:hypothetical protein